MQPTTYGQELFERGGNRTVARARTKGGTAAGGGCCDYLPLSDPLSPKCLTRASLPASTRGLRESSAASQRAQLLVARLQLQEQRINTVWRQLSEVEDKLQANEKSQAAPEQMLKLMGSNLARSLAKK